MGPSHNKKVAIGEKKTLKKASSGNTSLLDKPALGSEEGGTSSTGEKQFEIQKVRRRGKATKKTTHQTPETGGTWYAGQN